jgi:hypothetical protein
VAVEPAPGFLDLGAARFAAVQEPGGHRGGDAVRAAAADLGEEVHGAVMADAD